MPVFNQSRGRIIRLIFLVAFLVILAQMFNLQVLSGKYRRLADANAIFPKIIYPERGIIYDRKGAAILNNAIMYDLMVTPVEVKKLDTAAFCRLMQINVEEFKKRLVEARIKNGPYRPSVFEDLLTPELQARFEENAWRFPGFVLVQRPVRVYPFNAAAHIMGYIGEVDTGQIRRSGYYYRMGDYVGKNGLEAHYEKVLMGQRGVQYMIKDNFNRLVGHYEDGIYDTAAVPGRGLHTYIDVEVQQLAEKLMQNKVGGLVAIEPSTGGIIAMVSAPNFNPNDLTGPDWQKNYARLALDVSAPLLNRAIKGQYAPGSTFKPIGGLVALDENVIKASFGMTCNGAYYGCSRPLRCTHAGGGHASNLRLAIANSCNSYFSHIYRLTVDNRKYGDVKEGYQHWKEYMNSFGLGKRLGVDLPSEDNGNIPDTSVYNRVYRNSWNSCTNISLGIGQDMMLSTPLQLANAMCLIANKGYYYTPHFVKSIEDETEVDTILKPFKVRHNVLTRIPDSAYNAIIWGMQDVVERGTARVAQIPGIDVCAKTGTAENKRVIDGKVVQLKDNSIFVCFAPRENPKIAIAVVVENAGFGSTWAGPIAALMMEKYLNDTLRPEKVKEVERIAGANLMPSYLERLQYKEDSIRAIYWFKLTGDSAYIKKYISAFDKNSLPGKEDYPDTKQTLAKAMLPSAKRNFFKKPSGVNETA